jgi:SAM-dependent methyltransferase
MDRHKGTTLMDRSAYDRMAEIDADHWWFTTRRKIIARLIERYRPKAGPLKILEVGCGTGSNLSLLQAYGDVDAIEPDDGARALAEQRSGLTIKGGYLPHGVPLEDGHYDLIVLLDVLEHIPEDVPALSALRSKLAPGGRILITVPAMPWLWSAHDVVHHHQRRYTAGSLTKTIRDSGLKPVHRTHFNSLLFPLIVAVRALGKLTKHEGGDDAMPSRPVNGILAAIFGVERHWVTTLSVPFGVSMAMVAEPTIR